MQEFARGIHVPYWISLVLCYFTLFQRLVVPFGFYLPRYRLYSVLMLGIMHVGYAILMKVTIFPLIGISSLLMILPVREEPSLQRLERPARKRRRTQPEPASRPWAQTALIGALAAWLLCEPVRLACTSPTLLENRLLLVPAWRMFADVGISAGMGWRVILETPSGDVDVTKLGIGALPHTWRDLFYIDAVLHDILGSNLGPDALPIKMLTAAQHIYCQDQLRHGATAINIIVIQIW